MESNSSFRPDLRSVHEMCVLQAQLNLLGERGGCVLVGQQPNAACELYPEGWLLPEERSGTFHTANRLLAYSGLTPAEYLRVFPLRTNALDRCGAWDQAVARLRVLDLVRRLHSALIPRAECCQLRVDGEAEATLVCLGRKAWLALQAQLPPGERCRDLAPYEGRAHTFLEAVHFPEHRRDPTTLPGIALRLRVRCFYVPHTSGLTRAYNTPEQRAACRTFFQALRDEVLKT